MSATAESSHSLWLIRIPEVFADLRPGIWSAMGASSCKQLGAYDLLRLPAGVAPRGGPMGIFVPWCLPVEHAWPCDPGIIKGFIEKAASALARKFAGRKPRTVWVGMLHAGPGDGWFKRLSSNLRGRCLQLFPDSAMPLAEAGGQRPDEAALFCMVGAGGLYAGMASPRECNGFYPGGLVHLPKSAVTSISRAGAKIAAALHNAALHGTPPGIHDVVPGKTRRPAASLSKTQRRAVFAMHSAHIRIAIPAGLGILWQVMLPKQPNKSLIDGIACLQVVASRSEHIGVSEVSQVLGIEQTKVHRLLRTLAHLGFTQQDRSRKYAPGPAIYALAAQALYASHFIRDALGPLEELRAKQPHIVTMGVVWNRRVSYLYHAKRGVPLEEAIGTFGNWPAVDSGIGLAVMAGFKEEEIRHLYQGRELGFFKNGLDGLLERLGEVRARGYAEVETHSGHQYTTIGLSLKSNPMVGVGVSGHLRPGHEDRILDMLRATAEAIDANAERFAADPLPSRIERAI